MKKYIKIIGLCTLAIVLLGCQGITNQAFSKIGYEKIDQANQQIEQIKKDASKQISDNNDKIKQEEETIKNISFQKEQDAADELFVSELTFNTIETPTRPEVVINTHVLSAAAYLPAPTNAAIQSSLVEVKKELDTALTTNADLTAKVTDAQTQNKILSAQTQTALTAIDALKAANASVVNTTNDKITSIQNAKDTIEKNLVSALAQKADNSAEENKIKEKIMVATGILALLCIAGSIWSPVFKTECIEGAVLFGFITLCIPYIQGWMLLAAGGVIIAFILIKVGLQHNTAVNTIAASTNMPAATVAKAVASNTTALLVNDPVPIVTPIVTPTTK